MRERYEQLKKAAIKTLKEYGNGIFFREDKDFDKARYYPYPLMRYYIAMELYKTQGVTLATVGKVMGIDHSTLSIGISKVNYGGKKETKMMRMFLDNVELLMSEAFPCNDRMWRIDEPHKDMLTMFTREFSSDEVAWYTENDDLAQFIMSQ